MSLNIKKPRVHDLAREAASRTGLSQTSVIEVALERYLETLEDPDADTARWQRVDDLVERMHLLLTDEDRRALATDDLYDDHGLPV